MTKNKLLLYVGIIIFAIFMGCTIGFNGVFFFTTDYYKTPEKAISKNWGHFDNIEIKKKIDVINVTDNSCLYVGITTNDDLFVAELYVKNNKFSFLGNYTLYNAESDDYSKDYGIVYNQSTIYDSNGKKERNFKYAVLYRKLNDSIFEKNTIFNYYYDNQPYDELIIVHKIELP